MQPTPKDTMDASEPRAELDRGRRRAGARPWRSRLYLLWAVALTALAVALLALSWCDPQPTYDAAPVALPPAGS